MARERERPERSRRNRDDDGAGKQKSVGYRGRAGIDRVDEETERAEARRNKTFAPFRYKADWKKKAKNPIIILDASLDDAFFLHEHSVQDAQGNWGRQFEVCVREQDNCPLCALQESGRKDIGSSSYVMCLTVLDLKPYENKQGEKVYHSKKLFVIKNSQQQDWLKVLEKAQKRFGTLRGVYMELGRSSDKDAATGKPMPLELDWYGEDADDKPFSIVEEDDLIDEYGHDAIKSDSGRVIKEQDADITTYDYPELYPYPDVEELAKKYGSKSRAGSQDDNEDDGWREDRSSRGRGRNRDSDDEKEERSSRRSRRSRDEEDEDTEEAEERRPVSRSRRNRDEEDEKPAKASRRSRRSTGDDEEAEPEEAEERGDEDEAPPPPSRTKRESKAQEEDEAEPPKTRSRKSRKPELEDAEEDAAPKRKSRAGRSRKAAADEDDDEIPF